MSTIIPTLQVRNIGHREVKGLAQGHTANKWGLTDSLVSYEEN